MATIDIKFNFSRGSETHSDCMEFDAEGDLLFAIDEYKESSLDDLNADLEDDEEEWDFEGWEIDGSDADLMNPIDFTDLNEYAEYAEGCEKHGEGYRLRYDDIGEFNFENDYEGCWNSEEEFVQNMIEGSYEIPDHLQCHIDWESYARDVMMDYSTYDGNEGIHIFRN